MTTGPGLAVRARQVVAPLLRVGPRRVVWTNEGMRLGNLLYLWLHSHSRRQRGHDVRTLANRHTPAWDALWRLTEHRLVISRAEVRPWDRRSSVPLHHFQTFGQDFSRDELDEFAAGVLLQGPFRELVEPDDDTLTINVRRGDFVTVPDYRRRYWFDVPSYLETAVAVAVERSGRPRVLRVVTDDPDWCRTELAWLARHSTSTFEVSHQGPLEDLAALASSSRLVLANSTFSYWGGYLSSVVHDNPDIIAPRFHARHVDKGLAWQLDPRWTAIDTEDS